MDSKRELGGGVRGVLLGIPHDVANGGLLRPSSVLRDVGGTCGDPRAAGWRRLASEVLSEEGGASMSDLRVRPEWCASAQERLSGVWQHASAHRSTGGPREASGPFDLVTWSVTDTGRSLLRRICDALGAASGDGRVRLTTFTRRGAGADRARRRRRRLLHGTCHAVPGTDWHVPCTGQRRTPRRARKNSRSSLAHAAARTPPCISTRWLRRRSVGIA